ncbi:MAG: hypothetical protein ACJAU0_001249 [Flavobacteriales bacterium]|jgi:hypothetical protein
MKKIYALAFASLFASAAAFGQSYQPLVKNKQKETRRAQDGSATVNTNRIDFYTNDFSNCDDWVIDNAFENGLTQFVSDLFFECGTGIQPDGPAAIDAINSPSADNGFMMIDSDEYGGEEGFDGVENSWFQSADAIDCTDHPFVSISMQSFYRMWDNGSSDGNEYCLVEVSRDGTTWPDLETFEVADGFVDFGDGDGSVQARWELFPEMSTQDVVNNPTEHIFDLTSAAGGQATVYLRFRWKGTWGYAWMVDDVVLYDTPNNDVRIDSYLTWTDYIGTGMYEYSNFPLSQATEIQFASKVRNLGINDQTNLTLGVQVNGEDAASSDAMDLLYLATDTLRAAGYVIPGVVGEYIVDYALVSDQEDESPENNIATQSFNVTEYSYGVDNDVFSGVFPFDGADAFVAKVLYQFAADVTIYAIDVAIMEGSDPQTPIIAHVMDFETLDDYIVSSDEAELNPAFLNATTDDNDVTWYTMLLDDPFDVLAGEGYVAAFEHYGGSSLQIGESKDIEPQTAFVYGDFGSAIDNYFTTEVPMVRFNLDPNAGQTPDNVSENTTVNFELFQNNPNPANAFTNIRYTLEVSNFVTFEVTDITGKRVEFMDLGQQAAGGQRISFNVANLEAGMYQYTVTVGGERATRKMMVK